MIVFKYMEGTMKMIECDPKCGFMVRSHNEKEVMDMGMTHAKTQHPDMNTTEEQMKGMMKDA